MIVFGLGNPGEEHLLSRHNLGFMVTDALALRWKWRFRAWQESLVAKGIREGSDVWLVKPLSYMNRSGRVVARTLAHRADEFIVVVDDVDLPFGTLRLRKQGGTSGHNGLASISDHLHTEEFLRLRIGIGPRPLGEDLSDYVLAQFTRPELDELPAVIDDACFAVKAVIASGIDVAMNEVNVSPPDEDVSYTDKASPPDEDPA